MSVKTICDNCGKEIRSLSNRIRSENNTGVEVAKGRERKHVCAECILGLIDENKQ